MGKKWAGFFILNNVNFYSKALNIVKIDYTT